MIKKTLPKTFRNWTISNNNFFDKESRWPGPLLLCTKTWLHCKLFSNNSTKWHSFAECKKIREFARFSYSRNYCLVTHTNVTQYYCNALETISSGFCILYFWSINVAKFAKVNYFFCLVTKLQGRRLSY